MLAERKTARRTARATRSAAARTPVARETESCPAPGGGDARQEFLLPDLFRHRRNELKDYSPVAVHKVRFWWALHAPIDCGAAVAIEGHGGVGVAELRQPQLGLVLIVPIVESNDGNHMLASDRQQLFLFLPASHTPGGPNIEYIDLALERRGAHGARRIEHIGKRELRGRLADQRRGQLVDVAVRVQAKREQHHQRDECRKRQQELPRQAAPSSGRGFGGDTAPGAAIGTLTR